VQRRDLKSDPEPTETGQRTHACRRGLDRVAPPPGHELDEEARLILVCVHCAGQFRVEESVISEPGSRIRCPTCGNVFIVNAQPEAGPRPQGGAGSGATDGPPARTSSEPRSGGRAGDTATKRGAPPPDRMAAARDAVDDLLKPQAAPVRWKVPKGPPKPRRLPGSGAPPRAAARDRAKPPPEPSRPQPRSGRAKAPPQPRGPQTRGPRAKAPPEPPRPQRAAPPADPIPTFEPPASALERRLEQAREVLRGLGEVAAGLSLGARVAGALLLFALAVLALWPDAAPSETASPAREAASGKPGAEKATGGASAPEGAPTSAPTRMGGWAGVAGSAEPAPPAALAPAAPSPAETRVATEGASAASEPATASLPTAPPPAAAAPTPAPAKPPAAKTTRAAPRARRSSPAPTASSRTATPARKAVRSPSPTRTPSVRRYSPRRSHPVVRRAPPPPEKPSEAATSQPEGDSGWVVEY
jgi:predicted Zn finger-like uncharacterized protein